MIKQSGRKVGLRFGINDWHRKLKRCEKSINAKIVRRKLKSVDVW